MSKPPNVVTVERQGADFYALRVTEGEYENVIFTIGKVQLVENEEKTECTLKYDFKIDKVPEPYNIKELNDNIDFKNTVGDILVSLLEESSKIDAEKPKETDTEQSST
jgi:hypothetical protein|tara:strand:+ start:230 stop:553 length:324 start_codon:yes stop_codon:yes gene_type:complete